MSAEPTAEQRAWAAEMATAEGYAGRVLIIDMLARALAAAVTAEREKWEAEVARLRRSLDEVYG